MTPDLLLTLHLNRLDKFYQNSNYCDISIIVGENQNTQRIFSAHSAILVAQSQYFAVALSDAWVKREQNKMIIFKKPNIEPRVFEILLRYIYSGKIDLPKHGVSTLLDLLVAADELILEDLIEYIQSYLLEYHSKPLTESFALVNQIAFEHNSFTKLQEFCTDITCQNPAVIFQSTDFTKLHESALVCLLERDDLNLNEIDLWEKVLEWGISQAADAIDIDLTIPTEKWTHNEFKQLKCTLENCLPLIRFFHINSVDFYNKVMPYAEILPGTLYKDLLHHYLVPGSEENKATLHPIRKLNTIDSSVLSANQAFKIINWIKEQDDNQKNKSIELKLLLRGSRDGYKSTEFHRLCDNKGPTVVAIRVKDEEKIIGGYNPFQWNSLNRDYSDLNSFLYKFTSNDILATNGVLSKYNKRRSVGCYKGCGPIFGGGSDLILDNNSKNYCIKSSYDHGLLSSDGQKYFDISDYEVFQVVPYRNKCS